MTPYMKTIFQQKKKWNLTKISGSAPLRASLEPLITIVQWWTERSQGALKWVIIMPWDVCLSGIHKSGSCCFSSMANTANPFTLTSYICIFSFHKQRKVTLLTSKLSFIQDSFCLLSLHPFFIFPSIFIRE